MSTRAAIARPTTVEAGENVRAVSFAGVYHHWDGYPSGLGAELFRLNRDLWGGDTAALLKVLIDEHPAGWSTINGADWSLPAGEVDDSMRVCIVPGCGRANWMHYRQYYEGRGLPTPEVAEVAGAPAWVFDHGPEHAERPEPPRGYGKESEGWLVTPENASGSGIEWVYVLDADRHVMQVLGSYVDGQKMIGMFGMGAENADWAIVAEVDLNGDEPDWEAIAS